ncbi:MAG: ABC transporter ATP-binding protein [Lachnospiraceae bacterium]|nr:ABC transporter ATP-binding protein [Lachnospiraceae bacterium]
MEDTILKVTDVNKKYGRKEVLKGVSLHVNRGDIYGVIGKNGAGKTTLFKLLLGLSNYEQGTIELFGNSSARGLARGRNRIGFFVGATFFPQMTARQNLRYYAIMKGIKDKKEIDRVLKLVGLEGVKLPYRKFSLGMKQRVGIANAMLGNPEIMILDEPTNGLDPQGIKDVRETLQHLNKEYNTTIIISSHILGELQHTANRFGILNEGTIVREIDPRDLVTDRREIRLSVDDLEKAERVLEENGIQILGEYRETVTLEDYYFSLVSKSGGTPDSALISGEGNEDTGAGGPGEYHGEGLISGEGNEDTGAGEHRSEALISGERNEDTGAGEHCSEALISGEGNEGVQSETPESTASAADEDSDRKEGGENE